MNNKRSPTKNAGLTLVEITVSMLIFALIMGGLANLFTATKRLTLHARSRMVAGELGRYFLDQLQMQVKQDEWGSNCLGTKGVGGTCPDQTESLDDVSYTASFTVSDAPGSSILRKVKVTISWSEL